MATFLSAASNLASASSVSRAQAVSRNLSIRDFLTMPKVAYVAYIDKSGDDGLFRVQPINSNGASEWFVLSALVVPADMHREAVWAQKILTAIKSTQRKTLHFQPLDEQRQVTACKLLATFPVRCFAVVSNKQNMKGYTNSKAAKVSYSAGRTWFYWWCTRLLLERVTDYCERRSLHEFGEPRLVRLEFARREGLRYSHCQGYLFWLRMQSRTNTLYLTQGDLKWSVIDPIEEIRVRDPAERAGLQLTDLSPERFTKPLTAGWIRHSHLNREWQEAKTETFSDTGLSLCLTNICNAQDRSKKPSLNSMLRKKSGRPPYPETPLV